MPYVTRQVWVDEEEGPDAFKEVRLFNQKIWDNFPEKVSEAICNALDKGGFSKDHINRRAGNYEGQIMAIRRELVNKQRYSYRINDTGRDFLRQHKKDIPEILVAFDSWHGSAAEYCIYETTYHGQPALKFAEELIAPGLCMHPIFRPQDAEVLRDYISTWLTKLAGVPTGAERP